MEKRVIGDIELCIFSVSDRELALVKMSQEAVNSCCLFCTREGELVFTCHGHNRKGWLPSITELKWLAKADYFFCCYPGYIHWSWRLFAKITCKLGFSGYIGEIQGGVVFTKDLTSVPLELKQSSMVFSIIRR